jgi:hypothetical protein
MDIGKRKILFGLIVLLFGCVLSDKAQCDVYKCTDQFKDGKCQQKDLNQQTGLYNFLLQNCPKDKICQFNPTKASSSCKDIQTAVYKLYPGSSCTKDEDCLDEITCVGSVCVGKKEGYVCTDHSQCEFGKGCIKNDENRTCTALNKEGQACNEDYDCERHLGCYKKQCTPYFSLDLGADVSKELTGKREKLPITLCKSGYELNNKCETMERITDDCTDTCDYKLSNGEKISLPENCICGYNNDGKKYCKIGTNDDKYKDLATRTMDYLKNTPKCNTLERLSGCIHYRKFHEDQPSILHQKVVNSFTLVERFNEFEHADSCVLSTVVPNYNDSLDPPVPDIKKCPKYSCEKASSCALSHFITDAGQNNVKLDKSICKSSEICFVGSPPWVILATSKQDVSGVCKTATSTVQFLKRFPGEACDDDHPCMFDTCSNKVCPGKEAGKDCTKHEDCLVGNFCDLDKKVCTAQKKTNDACSSSYQCQNNLVCINDKCIAGYYSQPSGTQLKLQENFNLGYLCEFGIVDETNTCAQINLLETIDNESGLAKCDINYKCKYDMSGKYPFTQPCECGYNSDGQGYCPNGHNIGNLYLIVR